MFDIITIALASILDFIGTVFGTSSAPAVEVTPV